MTRPLVIEIGAVRIDAAARPEDAARIEAVLRDGLSRLAERLDHSALARDPSAVAVALDEIRITDLNLEDWLGPRGAHRLADMLYDRLGGPA